MAAILIGNSLVCWLAMGGSLALWQWLRQQGLPLAAVNLRVAGVLAGLVLLADGALIAWGYRGAAWTESLSEAQWKYAVAGCVLGAAGGVAVALFRFLRQQDAASVR